MTTRYRTIFILAAITALSFLCVDIFYKTLDAKLSGFRTKETSFKKTVRQKSVEKPSLNAYRVILKRNLFGSIDKTNGKIQINVDELEPTKLGLALLGTVSGTGGFDFAVIEEKDKKKQGLFREGDSVAVATIIRIMRGMVVLRVDGRDEILKMEKGDQRSEVGGRRSRQKDGGQAEGRGVKKRNKDKENRYQKRF